MKNLIYSTLSILLFPLIFVSCSNDINNEATPISSTQQTEIVTISFAIFDWEQTKYDALISEFEKENPYLRIEKISINQMLGISSSDLLSANDYVKLASMADVLSIRISPDRIPNGTLLDISPYITSDESVNIDDFYPGLLDSVQWDGGTWGLPTEGYYSLIFYNRDIFDQAGVAYPHLSWTWDDMVSVAQTLTIQEEEVQQWGFVHPHPPHLIIQSHTGSLITPSNVIFNTPATTTALNWYIDLLTTSKITPHLQPSSYNVAGVFGPRSSQALDLIDEERAAVWYDFSPSWESLNQEINVGVAPIPSDSANTRTTLVFADSLSISAGTMNSEAAWHWLSFLTQQITMEDNRMVTGVPARRSLAISSNYWESIEDGDLRETLQYAVEHAYGSTGYDQLIFHLFLESLPTIIDGNKTPEQALAEMQSEAQSIIESVATEPVDVPSVNNSKDNKTTNTNVVSIDFGIRQAPTELEVYRELAAEHNRLHPNIKVNVQTLTPESYISLKNAASEVDCFEGFVLDVSDIDSILSLTPFMDADPSINANEFFPGTVEEFMYQGQLWALPSHMQIHIIAYNKDIFDAYNVDYPSSSWTTDDFLDIATQLTQGEGETKQYGFVPDVFESLDFFSWLTRLVPTLVDNSVDPPTIAFTKVDTIETIRWYTDLTTIYEIKPILSVDPTRNPRRFSDLQRALIEEGLAAMWSVGASLRSPIEETTDFDIGYVPLPMRRDGYKGSAVRFLSGNFISSVSDPVQAEVCWQWLTYLSKQSISSTDFPAHRVTAESNIYQQRFGTERHDAYLASAESSTKMSYLPGLSDIGWLRGLPSQWLMEIYEDIIINNEDVEDVLNDAQRIVDEYRICVIENNALNNFAEQGFCLQEVENQYP